VFTTPLCVRTLCGEKWCLVILFLKVTGLAIEHPFTSTALTPASAPWVLCGRKLCYRSGPQSWPLVGFPAVATGLKGTVVLFMIPIDAVLSLGIGPDAAFSLARPFAEEESAKQLMEAAKVVKLDVGSFVHIPSGHVVVYLAAWGEEESSFFIVQPVVDDQVLEGLSADASTALKQSTLAFFAARSATKPWSDIQSEVAALLA
jgi:hypothetical protein